MDVTINGAGSQGNIEAQVDPTFQAIRANFRPLEFIGGGLVGGHYFMAASFSATAATLTAGAQIFSMRWADTRLLYVLKRITAVAALTTNFGAAQLIDVDVIKATSFSSNPSGGSAITPATSAQKARSNQMSGSLLATEGAMQISSGGGLTAGTQTLDTQPFGYAQLLAQSAVSPVIIATPTPTPLYELRDFGVHPLVLSANEGFVIRNSTLHGATGVTKFGFTIEWAEVPSY